MRFTQRFSCTRARHALDPCLEPHERSVGTFIEVEHLAPVPEGFTVVCRARVIHSDGPPKGRRERRERAFAAGLVSGHEQSSTDPALATAVRSGVKLAKIEPFWKR